ncbi:L,D-transpeptidase family protein [Adhaeribacter soli]|nr:L,D-transpeptidase family protein [Adhaeribacter soli]
MSYAFRLKFLFILPFLLVLFVSCGQQSNKNEENNEKASTSDSRSAKGKVVVMDSVFIISYVRSVPEFKEHEKLVRLFYRDRGFKLAWFKNGELVPQANKFKEVISKADQEGLNPDNYKLKNFDQMYKAYVETKDEATQTKLQQELDIALTASYFHYGTDFYKGMVNPRKVSSIDWKVKKNKIKLNKALQTILKERESKYPYYEFAPLHPEYDRLRTALKKYRDLQQFGEWPKVEEVKKLKPNDVSPQVAVLRKRLLMEYEPQKAKTLNGQNDTLYDANLEVLVKKFQELNGLKADGVIGPATVKLLNIPLDDRIDQLIINMERWRWIPKKFEDKYIFVNIPRYTMHVIENGKEVLTMKVIVGKSMHSTPVFSDKLEYVVFSPYWNVPNSIVENEIKPNMLKNPNFLASQNMEIVSGQGKNVKQVSPSSIDWNSVTAKNFKLLIRQKPGPKNALGPVKFLFPNEYNVYLHGTPFENLFNQDQRGFSHGCIRLEDPASLAEYLLKDRPEWDPEAIQQAMATGEEQWVTLKAKVPVYIVYFTSWVDNTGNVHFYQDLYNHDEDLKKEYFG